MTFWQTLGAVLLTILIAFISGLFYMGIRRKVIARIQNRYGPPLHQNFLDVMKLWSKESNIHHGIMQHLAPLWMIAMGVSTLLFIPIVYNSTFWANFTFKGDLILLLYLMVFGSLGFALGAGQTGNPNSAIGVTRGLSQMVGFEIPWVMALIAVMIQYKTTSLTDLVAWQQQHHTWIAFQQPFAFLAALLVIPAMFRYSPYDIVIAPSELASGPPSEFGGKYMGLMMSSGSIFMFAKLALIVDIFLGGATSWLWMIIKTLSLYMIPVLWSAINPRYRTEQAIWSLWRWPLIFAVLGLIIASV